MGVCTNCSATNRIDAEFCGKCGTKLDLQQPVAAQQLTKRAKKPRGRALLKTLVWLAVAAVAIGAGYFASRVLTTSSNPGAKSEPTPSQSKASLLVLNDFGVPVSCSDVTIVALAKDLMFNQMGATGKMRVRPSGYSTSQTDSLATGSEMVPTVKPENFAHLDCMFEAGKDSFGNATFSTQISFDSVSEPRNLMGDIDEQELKLNLGEKMLVYYPSGGYEYGTGHVWRLWIADQYIQIETWAAEVAHSETLKKPIMAGLLEAYGK